MRRWVAYEVDKDYPLLGNAVFHEYLNCLYRGSSGRWGVLLREARYNPTTVQRTKHRVEEKDVAVGNIRRELQWGCVRACRLNGITSPTLE